MTSTNEDSTWEQSWDARVAALQSIYGKMEDNVGHAVVPFEFGADAGGSADIVYFKNHVAGVVAVTSELIGRDDQIQNELGNYELAICTRSEEPWAGNLISRLAHYTLEAKLSVGETMDIGPALPEGSSIAAFLFLEFGRFKVLNRDAGVLLCFGITAEELKACRSGRRDEVEKSLRDANIFPFTELTRKSILPGKASKRWWQR